MGQPGIPTGVLTAHVNQVGAIAERLDQYGDTGDKTKTEEQFRKLSAVLQNIEEQYPKSALS